MIVGLLKIRSHYRTDLCRKPGTRSGSLTVLFLATVQERRHTLFALCLWGLEKQQTAVSFQLKLFSKVTDALKCCTQQRYIINIPTWRWCRIFLASPLLLFISYSHSSPTHGFVISGLIYSPPLCVHLYFFRENHLLSYSLFSLVEFVTWKVEINLLHMCA